MMYNDSMKPDIQNLKTDDYTKPLSKWGKKWFDIKDNIRCFISDITPGWVYRLQHKFHDLWYGIFVNRHWMINTRLPIRSWYDSDTRILHGMMTVLAEFHERELLLDIVNWDSDDAHKEAKKEMDEIYAWWLNYKTREKEISDTLTAWSDRIDAVCKERQYVKNEHPLHFIDYLNDKNKDSIEAELNVRLRAMEEQLGKEEDEMLARLLKIRRFMWT